MSDFFRKFPIISYNGVRSRDITRRVIVNHKSLQDPYLFLPYTVQEVERPEDLAYYYYGSVDYTWLVLLANNMLDPYTDWPMTTENFNQYFIAKYADQSGATSYEVIDWGQNQTISENIAFFYKQNERGEVIQVDRQTFENSAEAEAAGWQTMRLFDYEWLLNEQKRTIRLIDSTYKDTIDSEMRKLLIQ